MSPKISPRAFCAAHEPRLPEAQLCGFHVALDTSLARRAPDAPDEILVNGFLLLDCGGYELCTAHLSHPHFWQMKAMDMFGATRQAAAEQARNGRLPPAGSVWHVEACVSGRVAGSLRRWNHEGGPEDFENEVGAADEGSAERIHHLNVAAVTALDRIWIGSGGPRLFEAYDAAALLPGTR